MEINTQGLKHPEKVKAFFSWKEKFEEEQAVAAQSDFAKLPDDFDFDFDPSDQTNYLEFNSDKK